MLHVKNIQFSIPVVYQYCSAGIPDTSILLSIDLPKMSELRRKREGAHRLRPLKSHPGEPEALAVSTLAERIYQKLKSDIIHNFFQAGKVRNQESRQLRNLHRARYRVSYRHSEAGAQPASAAGSSGCAQPHGTNHVRGH